MTDDQIIEVVKAHKEGKVIQWCNADKNDWADYQVCSFKDSGLNFDFMHYDYRIKSEPKLRPYRDAKEFLAAQKEHGPYLIDTAFGEHYYMPTEISNTKIWFYEGTHLYTYSAVMSSLKWQDGTPCGIIDEE